jgi:hypothetical protein
MKHWHVYDDTQSNARPSLVWTELSYEAALDRAMEYARGTRIGEPVCQRSHPKLPYRQATIFFGSTDNYGRAILVNECSDQMPVKGC